MIKEYNLVTHGWSDYELLDSGDHMKLERFGNVILARPETQSIWSKSNPKLWEQAHAVFTNENAKGVWNSKKEIPGDWQLKTNGIKAQLQLTNFKHIGIFPEQVSHWNWIQSQIQPRATKNLKVLNLFGYTGVASCAAAISGAVVTHVDSSKQSVAWAKSNAENSNIPSDRIRWIIDDALKFAKREVRRAGQYDGIILDPPAFGRGAKNEVWHIEEHLLELMNEVRQLLSPNAGSFLILNGYAAGYTAVSFKQLVESTFEGVDVEGEYGELQIKEKETERVISSGIYTRIIL